MDSFTVGGKLNDVCCEAESVAVVNAKPGLPFWGRMGKGVDIVVEKRQPHHWPQVALILLLLLPPPPSLVSVGCSTYDPNRHRPGIRGFHIRTFRSP